MGRAGSPRTPPPGEPRTQGWKRKPGRPSNPGLVVYARVDGSFSVGTRPRITGFIRWPTGAIGNIQPVFHFTPDEVLNELLGPDKQVVCRGLIDDWTRWQQVGDPRLPLCRLIEVLLTWSSR